MKQLVSCWPVVVLALLGASLSPESALASAGPGQACNVQTSTCYASIHANSNAAASGNTIDIGVDTYAAHLSVSTSLTLQEATTGSSIVDGSVNGTVLTVGTGIMVTVVDLTLRNGSNTIGGGIVTRSGHTVLFQWRMAVTHGIAGFNLLSGAQRLNQQLILAHAGRSYRYLTVFSGHSAFRLELVFAGGTTVAFRPH